MTAADVEFSTMSAVMDHCILHFLPQDHPCTLCPAKRTNHLLIHADRSFANDTSKPKCLLGNGAPDRLPGAKSIRKTKCRNEGKANPKKGEI